MASLLNSMTAVAVTDPGNHPLRGKAYTAGNDQCHGSDRPHLPWNRRLRSGTVHLDKELIPLTGSDLFPVLPLQPVFTTIMGALFLGEHVTVSFLIGLVLISLDIVINIFATSKEK